MHTLRAQRSMKFENSVKNTKIVTLEGQLLHTHHTHTTHTPHPHTHTYEYVCEYLDGVTRSTLGINAPHGFVVRYRSVNQKVERLIHTRTHTDTKRHTQTQTHKYMHV